MKDKVLKACITLIEKEGWKSFTFAKASEESGIPLDKFHAQFTCHSDVIVQLFKRIDQEVLKNLEINKEMSRKDVLFEILMARFDAAEPYKTVIGKFWRDWLMTPEDTPAIIAHGYSSMAWMLEAAGINNRGLTGLMRIQGLATLYLYTLKTWLEDDTLDLSKTMVALDKGLSKLERAASYLKFV
jgi:hypothetical protein